MLRTVFRTSLITVVKRVFFTKDKRVSCTGKIFSPSLFTFMQNLKTKVDLRNGKQLIAWKSSCTCWAENKAILHFQNFTCKNLIKSVLFPVTTILIQVNFLLEKNCWNNALFSFELKTRAKLAVSSAVRMLYWFFSSIILNCLLALLTSFMTHWEAPSKTNTSVIL